MLILVWLIACTGASTDTDECYAYATGRCAETPKCAVISGRSVTFADTGGGCYDGGAATAFGCHDAGEGCDEAETWAVAPDGTCVLFPSRCTPTGWTVGPTAEVCGATSAIGECAGG